MYIHMWMSVFIPTFFIYTHVHTYLHLYLYMYRLQAFTRAEDVEAEIVWGKDAPGFRV